MTVKLLGYLMGIALMAATPARAEDALAAFFGVSALGSDDVNHAAFDAILKAHVRPGADGINRVDYAVLKAGPDWAALKAYREGMEAVRVRDLPRPAQMAYWINLYNALTLEIVLEHYPVRSIRDIAISPGFFSVGPWGKKLVTVEGQRLSLDNIEHDILRKLWNDTRIHYAVNCASLGCPNLADRAFTAGNLEEQLERAARAYVNHPRGVRVEGKRLVASRIYEWYREDFTGQEGGLLGHLRRYAEPALAQSLQPFDRVARFAYDWSLNDIEH